MAGSAPSESLVKRLFSFPNPVNDVSARVVATGVVILAVTTLILDQPWITALLAYGFVARVATGPTLSPLGQFATRVAAPLLPFEAKLVDGPPKRFAQSMGAVFTVSAALLALVFDQKDVAYVLLALLLIPASLEAFAGYCIGCKIFGLLIRADLIPASVCANCADIWKGREHLRPPSNPEPQGQS
jgi:hypothetical protein